MPNFCIVCEFNPLHKGHEYLIKKARELGADKVTCVMSGNATQRGELAVVDKYLRAEAAVKCGADLVLELPYPWCSSSADYFATAAVSIAAGFGDVLLFGSECADAEYLEKAAGLCETDSFKLEYEARTSAGIGAAAAYVGILSEHGFEKLSSNDLLGIAYIRAIKRLGVNIKPMTVQRVGAAYNQANTVDGEYQSATAMRERIARQDVQALERFLPKPMFDIIRDETLKGTITDIKEADGAILGFLRLCDADELKNIADNEGGLSNRLVNAAMSSTSVEEMLAALRTKRYTDAKLRRATLFALTSVRAGALRRLPEYTQLLGANSKGRELLAQNRRKQTVRVVTKPADAPRRSEQYILSEKLDSLYGLARKEKFAADGLLRKKAYIEK